VSFADGVALPTATVGEVAVVTVEEAEVVGEVADVTVDDAALVGEPTALAPAVPVARTTAVAVGAVAVVEPATGVPPTDGNG